MFCLYRLVNRDGVEDTRLEAKAKDPKKFRGQGQTLPRPRPRTKHTDASVFRKKKGLQKLFSGDLKKKVLKKLLSCDLLVRKIKKGLRKFSARFLAFFNKISTAQKILLSSRRGQANFRGLEASMPRTSKCVLEDVFEAKDVLEDSTSAS